MNLDRLGASKRTCDGESDAENGDRHRSKVSSYHWIFTLLKFLHASNATIALVCDLNANRM